MTRNSLALVTLAALAPQACNSGGGRASAESTTDAATTGTGEPGTATTPTGTTGDTPTTSDSATGTTGAVTATTTDSGASSSTGSDTTDASSSTGPGCGACNEPNQRCIDDECVTGCQGVDPDPCGPAQVCDVISGACKDLDAACTVGGPNVACGANTCGPGSVCDGVDTCLPIAPCASVECTGAGACWGSNCACERAIDCSDPSLELLNGPFSSEIGGIDFADDCTAWMVTLRSGPDYLRRLKPDGELTEWAGVANLNMGEVKVLRSLTIPQLTAPLPFGNAPTRPHKVEGLGEVAISYTCCPACGCQADPPQGVARLVEETPDNPLPIVIVAQQTQGTGPFGSNAADAGPHGLTWGVDRVLYVGNSTDNGDFNSADLEAVTQAVEAKFMARVTAAAPVSPVHLVVGLVGGEVHRFNVLTKQAELVLDLGADITGFSHDNFTGEVYAGLSTLEIVVFDPFTAAVATFDTMPGKGRVTVSPSGNLYFAPVKYLYSEPITSYPLPNSF